MACALFGIICYLLDTVGEKIMVSSLCPDINPQLSWRWIFFVCVTHSELKLVLQQTQMLLLTHMVAEILPHKNPQILVLNIAAMTSDESHRYLMGDIMASGVIDLMFWQIKSSFSEGVCTTETKAMWINEFIAPSWHHTSSSANTEQLFQNNLSCSFFF